MSEAQEQPIPTKPEIFPSEGTSNVQSQRPIEDKTNGKRSSEKQNKKFSKGKIGRALLSAAALTSVMESTMFIPGDTAEQQRYPAIVRELSQQDIETRVEQLYQINILSPQELPEIEIKNEMLKTHEWTKEDIVELTSSLDQLPSHFYLPAASLYRMKLSHHFPKLTDVESENLIQQEEYQSTLESLKLIGKEPISREVFDRAREQGYLEVNLGIRTAEFLLVENLYDQNASGACFCLDPFTKQRIAFPLSFFKDASELPRLSAIGHELVHRVARPEDEIFISRLLELPDNISMQEFLKPNVKQVPSQLGFYVRPYLIHASENPSEFLAVGSEFYIGGKGRFLEVYSQFIGEQKAGKFYDYMRDNIFKGTEYKNYQKIIK